MFFSLVILAQKDESKDYAKMKEELNERIFGSVDPYFKSNTIPEEYKNEFCRGHCQKHTLESDSKFKYHIGFFASTGPKFYFFDIFPQENNDK
jgi:hypothetical protein